MVLPKILKEVWVIQVHELSKSAKIHFSFIKIDFLFVYFTSKEKIANTEFYLTLCKLKYTERSILMSAIYFAIQ